MNTPASSNASSGIAVLRNSMLFSLTRHQWSNRRAADRNKLDTTGDKRRFTVTKSLLKSPELDAIVEHLNEVYTWCFNRAMQSTAVRRGIYFVNRAVIQAFEDKLRTAEAKLRGPEGLVEKFLATYDERKEAMKLPAPNGLGDEYKERDYPTKQQLREAFRLEWSWLALSVPDELPEEVRERESAKLRESFEQAQNEIQYALRAGFADLIKHAVDRLSPDADGNPKTFQKSLVGNFLEFFDTFTARNFLGDAELEKLVTQAKGIVSGLPTDIKEAAEALRSSPDIRQTTVAGFEQLSAELGKLVVDVPVRKFNFDLAEAS